MGAAVRQGGSCCAHMLALTLTMSLSALILTIQFTGIRISTIHVRSNPTASGSEHCDTNVRLHVVVDYHTLQRTVKTKVGYHKHNVAVL